MAFCSNCGSKLDEGAAFCANCGTRVDEAAAGQTASQPAPSFQPQQPVYQEAVSAQAAGWTKQKSAWEYFTGAIKKYAVFQGRARRAEYWYYALFYALFSLPCYLIDSVTGLPIFTILFTFAFLLPGWGVMVRRYHDYDKRAWWVLVPIYGLLIPFFAGTVGPNRFGPDPKQNN
jgi:uncharacterized membrane protein YhaH (DUF805 family)